MRLNEVFSEIETLELDEQVVDEDLKSLGRKATTAIAAGGLAAAGISAMKAADASATSSFSQPMDKDNIKFIDPDIDMEIDQVDAPDYDALEKEKATERQEAFEHDVNMLALTMWGEARSHGVEGMRAVGHVIQNRLNSSRNFGDSIEGVVKKRKHFSCWNKGDPNRERMLNIDELPENSAGAVRWQEAQELARDILNGKSKDPTKGSLFYHTTAVKPAWADGVRPIAQVDNHVFYKTDSKA